MISRHFVLGFLLTLFLFIALNVLVAHFRSDCGIQAILGIAACADDIKRAGFPFLVWEEGGIAFHSYFDNLALMADVVVALLASIAGGVVAERFGTSGKLA
jgi:hypothetical protein